MWLLFLPSPLVFFSSKLAETKVNFPTCLPEFNTSQGPGKLRVVNFQPTTTTTFSNISYRSVRSAVGAFLYAPIAQLGERVTEVCFFLLVGVVGGVIVILTLVNTFFFFFCSRAPNYPIIWIILLERAHCCGGA